MQREVNCFKLFVKEDEKAFGVANKLRNELIKNNYIEKDDNYDLAISVGGDGTFLKMLAKTNFNNNVLYVGVNAGTLGFLQEIDIDKTLDFIERLNHNDYKIQELCIGKTIITTSNNKYEYNTINEVVIRKNDFTVLNLNVLIDHEFLEEFHGDGLLISTSTGTTAYNLSIGGAIVYNSLKTLALTPIAPIFNKSYRSLISSIIIPEDKIIEIIPSKETNLSILVDGKKINIDNVTKIECMINQNRIKCLRMNDYHFIKLVNDKILQ